MLYKIPTLLILASALSMSAAVDVNGYLENACNGELLFGFGDIATGHCYSVADYRASGSIAATSFGKNRRLNFFFNDDCTDQVAHATSDECYVHTQTGVKSFKLKKT